MQNQQLEIKNIEKSLYIKYCKNCIFNTVISRTENIKIINPIRLSICYAHYLLLEYIWILDDIVYDPIFHLILLLMYRIEEVNLHDYTNITLIFFKFEKLPHTILILILEFDIAFSKFNVSSGE